MPSNCSSWIAVTSSKQWQHKWPATVSDLPILPRNRTQRQRPPSPCKAICTLDRSASVCTGCGRTLGEIAEWGSATASRQHEIVRRSSSRMGSSASHQA
ncbi:DUF1289 domain-containing protein [Sphingopyxis sp. 2PD]|uniref:DUF1289 domain-containing protein n=1 Tax=Sphingopyxis sp. 2PD TaxID=2502196 RepID=UPI0010F92A18|nr:DUF1289 domain-containing protein [Sphingopyxis sp. 2PD]